MISSCPGTRGGLKWRLYIRPDAGWTKRDAMRARRMAVGTASVARNVRGVFAALYDINSQDRWNKKYMRGIRALIDVRLALARHTVNVNLIALLGQ